MTRRFHAARSVMAQQVEDDLVLLELESGEFFVARGTGPHVWRMLGDGCSPEEIAGEIAARYGMARERALEDVRAFVGELTARRLLEPDPETPE